MVSDKVHDVVRRLHKYTVLIYKKRDKLYVTDKQMSILKYIFSCHFELTESYLRFIEKKLCTYNIDYMIIDVSHSYDVINHVKFEDNNYKVIYKKARLIRNRLKRIDNIRVVLLNNKKLLKRVEKLMYE